MECHILFVFKVGHSVQRKPKPVNGRTHHWRCYVDSWNPRYPLSAFVKKVTFKLHNTFENPRQVVRQAPFAIEEDGFGTFQLQIEVAFLDCVTTFYYDLTLFDQNALHTYRTIQLDPAPEDWDKLIQLGGIAVPRTSNQCTVHEIVQTIQSYSDLESLHPFSFYPELESTKKSTNKDKLATSTSQAKMHDYSKTDACTNLKLSEYGSNDQNMHHEFIRRTPEDHNFLLDSDVNHSLQVSSSSSSSDRLLTNQFLPQKHKKKLQLLHEAQLLLEKAQQSQNWAPVISPPPPQIQPPMITNINSPEGSHMPSPDPSTWSSHFSPSRSSLHEQTDIVEQDHHSYKSQKSPVVHFHRKITNDTPFMKSPKSDPTKISYVVDSNKQENSAPKQRIVLKLSRSSCGSQLSVSSSQPLDDEFAVEKLDRKKHKKESKKERHDKSSRGSSSKHSLTNRPNTTVSTTVAGMSDKDMIETHIMSKLSSQIFSSETSSTSSKKHYSPRKYSSRDTCSNNSSPRLVYSQRKSGNASPKIRSEISSSESHSNKSNSDASMLGSANVKEDLLKLSKKGEENELSHRVSQQQRLKHQYSPMNELQQVGKDAFTSDADSLGDSYSRSTHSHLLLLDQKDDDYHDGCFPNDSGRETPVVDYFGDEMQQQREQHSTSVPHSIPPPAILSSSNVRNFRYADELSVVSGHNPGYSAASDGGSSRPYDPEERLTHSVAATSSELYEEDFDDFTPPKTYSTSDELNKPTNQILASKFTDQKCVKRSKIDSDESQLSLGKSKQYIDDKTESRLSKKSKIKISANSSNKCLSYSDVDFNKSIDPNIPAKQPKILNLSKSSDDRQSKSLSLSDSHSVEVHNRQKSSVKKFKSYDKSSCKPSITTVDHTKQFENSPGHNKTCLSSKDKGVKHTNKSTKNDRQPESSSKVSSEYETFSSISISGTQKSSKVLNSTETKKPTKIEKVVKDQSSRGSSSGVNLSKKPSSNSSNTGASISRFDKTLMDAELSSLSSDPSSASSSPSSSSVTPPMLSDDTCHLITMSEIKSAEESRNSANLLKLNEKKRGPTVAHQSSTRESMPNVVKAKSHLNPVGKNNLSGDNTSATTSTTTITTTTTATTISSSDSKKLEKDINLDIPPTTTNVQTKLTDSTKASSHNLEVLFDRLIRLREPHLAIRMSEILLYYISPKSPDSLERKNKSNSSMLNNSNRAVKVIHDNPKLIAFDLRKLPTSCIDKLTALIKEDEEISKKQNQTSAPSKSNMIKNYVCQNKTVVTRGYDWFDNVESSYQNSNHRDFSERENF